MNTGQEYQPVTYDNCDRVAGPFYHGTTAAVAVGAELVAGFGSSFQAGRVMNNTYFSALMETAVWGAELATAFTVGISGSRSCPSSSKARPRDMRRTAPCAAS